MQANYRAVLFDVGGVLVASPVRALAEYDKKCGLPDGFINKTIAHVKEIQRLWGDWESNIVSFADFCSQMDSFIHTEIEKALLPTDSKDKFNTREMIDVMESGSKLNTKLVECASRLRRRGIITCIITNNWYSDAKENDLEALMSQLRPHFDFIVESRLVRMRKPNPLIYKHALKVIGANILPEECIFLDDLGPNLKAAAALGIHTIKVTNEEQSCTDLEKLFSPVSKL